MTKKDARLDVRLPKEEKEEAERKAEQVGVSLSDVIRMLLKMFDPKNFGKKD